MSAAAMSQVATWVCACCCALVDWLWAVSLAPNQGRRRERETALKFQVWRVYTILQFGGLQGLAGRHAALAQARGGRAAVVA